MAKDTITIQFGAKGDQDVVKAINKLDRSTRKLISTQQSLTTNSSKGQRKQATSSQKAMTALNVKLKALGTSFKSAKIDTNLLTQAYKGNKLAIQKVRNETAKHIAGLGRQKKGLLDTEHGTRILGGSFAVLRSKMLLASFGASIFGASIGKLTNLFGQQEKAEKKLETAIGKHSNVLLSFASAQQKVTTFGDEELINAMSLVGAYTTNEKAIARITQASMDLASAKGMDLNSAIDLVSKSIFSSTNAMSRYGVEISGTQGSTERLTSATEAISNMYGGQAQAAAETFLGSMTQLGNSTGDLGEKFGSVLAPAVLLAAKGIKSFADSIDTEEIKAYSTALIGGATAYIAWTKGTVIATRAMALFNKMSKKNIAILAGMLIVGKLIDEFDLFADGVGDVSAELEKLNGELGNLQTKGTVSLDLTHKLAMAELNYSNTLAQLHPLEAARAVNTEEFNQLLQKHNVTQANLGRQMVENIPFAIAYNENQQKSAEIEQQLQQVRQDSVATGISGFIKLAQAQTKNAEKLKVLAVAQAMIDTMSGANKALASAPPPFNFIAMAGVIAQGMANVSQIQSQKFEQGGLVGGQRHSQGGTMIEAERGEFVMSRQAVESVGLETMNQINQGGGALSINVSAPLVDETILDVIIPKIQQAQAQNLA